MLKWHKYRERNRKLVQKKKESVLKKEGHLACQVCGFRYDRVYGSLGNGYIECHHVRPVHLMKPDERTTLNDLALVCANCHRMLHRDLTLSLEELKRKLKQEI
nr:HNH endonuclease [Spirosoma liriopis]